VNSLSRIPPSLAEQPPHGNLLFYWVSPNSRSEPNKAIVLEAFETLFNKRDYTAAERYWSPDYVQHSAHIAPGREGLFSLIKSIPQR